MAEFQGADGTGLLENLFGATAVGAALISTPLMRGWFGRWGATAEESRRPLPGDELTPSPQFQYTRAITIRARPEQVYPWIVQWGQERGGLYSYEKLENLIGCEIHNSNRILPEHQTLKVGDTVRLGKKGYPLFKVMAFEPNRYVLIASADPKTEQVTLPNAPFPEKYDGEVMLFYLEATPDGGTRFLLRGRHVYRGISRMMKVMWYLIDSVGFVMVYKSMRGIKARAEFAAKMGHQKGV